MIAAAGIVNGLKQMKNIDSVVGVDNDVELALVVRLSVKARLFQALKMRRNDDIKKIISEQRNKA